MNKIEPWPGCQFFCFVTENALEGWIHNLEITIETRDAQHIERKLKQPAQFRVGCGQQRIWIFLLLRGMHSAHYTLHHEFPTMREETRTRR
jgi:hypothetical protein